MSVHSAGYRLIHLHIHLELGSNLRIFGLRDRQAQHQIQVEVRGAGLQLSVGTDGVDVCAALQICGEVHRALHGGKLFLQGRQQILQKAVQAVIHLHGVYGAGARAGDVDGVDHGQHHAVHLAADL